MGQIKAAITDFDGTLVNTLEANAHAYAAAAEALGIEWNDELYRANFGLNWRDMAKVMGVPDDKAEELHEMKSLKYCLCLDKRDLNVDLLQFFLYLQEQGVKICIATTAAEVNVMNVLKHFQIDDWFDVIITGDKERLKGKPAPDIYLEALKKCKCNADEAIVFEDSEVGMDAAKAAGINFVKLDMNIKE